MSFFKKIKSINFVRVIFGKYGNNKLVKRIVKSYTEANKRRLNPGDDLEFLSYAGGCDLQQATHPDLFYDKNKKIYVLTVSDYPFGIAKFENSYIFISKDGINFDNPMKGEALDVYRGNGKSHYSDGEIIKDKDEFHAYYRFCEIDEDFRDIIYVRSSRNLRDWTPQEKIIDMKGDSILSPAIIEEDGKFIIYYVCLTDQGSILYSGESCDFKFSDFQNNVKEEIIENMPKEWMLWHINVSIDSKGNKHGMFTLSKGKGGKDARLFYATYTQGKWFVQDEICLNIDSGHIKKIYRAALVETENKLELYVSLCMNNDCWYVMRKSNFISI